MRTAERKRVALSILTPLLLGACRPDSLTLPGLDACGDPSLCMAGPLVPLTAAVQAAIDDASERLLPSLTDEHVRAGLAPGLRALAGDLAAERHVMARLRLAELYGILAQMDRASAGEALHPDAPTLAALRLALVAAGAQLGVAAP